MTRPISPASRAASAIERIGRLTREREAEAGLHPAQWEALRCLAGANQFSRSPSAVAAWLATTRGTASQTLMALERKGLISREANPRDKRASRLALTPAGAALLENDPLADLADIVSRLPPLHAAALGQALARVCAELLGASQRPAFRACAGCADFDAAQNGGGHCGRFNADLDRDEATRACVAHQAV